MYNPKIPNNSLKKLPLNFDFNDIDLLKQLNKTNIAITRLNGVAREIPNQNILLEFITVKESVQSNEIENIHTTITEVFKSELISDKNKLKYEDKEAINYKDALKYGINSIKDKGGISFSDILKLNEIILQKDIGIVSSPNKKVEKANLDGTKEVIYTPPQGVPLIKELLYNLEEYYNNFNEEIEIDPLLKLPIIHYQFEAIHPFLDGNGRVGRILMVLYLFLNKKLDVPIIYLSDFIIRYKADYYGYLNSIDKGEKNAVKDFILWLLIGIESQSLVTEITIRKILNLRSLLKDKLKSNTNINHMYSKELLDYLFIRPFYTNKTMSSYLRKHRNTTSSYLNLLEDEGILGSFNMGRTKVFVFNEFLELLDGRE